MLQSKTDKYENISVSRKRMPIAKGCSNAYLEQQSQYYYCKQNLLCEKIWLPNYIVFNKFAYKVDKVNYLPKRVTKRLRSLSKKYLL